MSDERKPTSMKPTDGLPTTTTPSTSTQHHPYRNSPQPPLHANEFKPIAIKTTSLSITPQLPTSPTLSAGPNRRQNPLAAERSYKPTDNENSRSAAGKPRRNVYGYDESQAEDASEIDTARMDIVTHSIPDVDAAAVRSTTSDHSDETLTGLDAERRSTEEKKGPGELSAKSPQLRGNAAWQTRGEKRGSIFSRYQIWDRTGEANEGRSGRVNRIRKRRVFMRADPKAYFSNERTTYSWMYLHILTLSFSLSLYAFPQASGNKFPPTHIAATIASGVALLLVLATAAQFGRRQQRLAQIHKLGEETSAKVFDESVHRFPTIVTLFVVAVLIVNIFCIWSSPIYNIKGRTPFSS